MASTRVVGLDIGTTGVRGAELEFAAGGRRSKSAPTLLRYGQVSLPIGAVIAGEVAESGVVSGALRELWRQAKFSTRDVIIGVGNQRVLVRELDLPWMPANQIRAALPYQVQESLPMSVDEALLDYMPTGEYDLPSGRTLQGMLVAAQRETVNANLLAVEGAGLRTMMVDLNAFALMRAMVQGDLQNRVVALIDIGARITNVVIAQHGIPRFVRTLPAGGQDVTDALAGTLGVPAPEADRIKREIGVGFAVPPDRAAAAAAIANSVQGLIEAIRNTFVFYQGKNPGAGIEVVVMTGGGTHLPGLGQYLASASRLPVTIGDPLAGLKVGKSMDRAVVKGEESLMAMPVGLASGIAA